MKTIGLLVAGGFASYLIGAIPTGFLVGRAFGVDVRRLGSGNIGATNVFRCVGKAAGAFTLACDILKGFVPAFLIPLAASNPMGDVSRASFSLLCAVLAVAGHIWPVYLGFRGGKGVATAAGAALGVDPTSVLIGAAVWTAVFLLGRYVSLASVVAAAATAAAAWGMWAARTPDSPPMIPVVFSLLAGLTILRHRSNLHRLWNGTEPRVPLRRG